eukprot:4528700-Pyramimonas_sp.AAC.1
MFTEALGVRLATGDAIGTLEMTDSPFVLVRSGSATSKAAPSRRRPSSTRGCASRRWAGPGPRGGASL